MDRLKNKVAIVTGAANGIGRAIAKRFASESAWVLVVDIEEGTGCKVAEGIEAAGGRAVFVRGDVSKREDVRNAIEIAAAQTGRIDVLCNNAAYLAPDFHGALDSTDEEWRRCIDVALLGTHYFTQAALPYMIAQKAGSIVNVVSIQGMEGMMTSAAYTATKAALLGYTMSVCYDYGLHSVRLTRFARALSRRGLQKGRRIRTTSGSAIRRRWGGSDIRRKWHGRRCFSPRMRRRMLRGPRCRWTVAGRRVRRGSGRKETNQANGTAIRARMANADHAFGEGTG